MVIDDLLYVQKLFLSWELWYIQSVGEIPPIYWIYDYRVYLCIYAT